MNILFNQEKWNNAMPNDEMLNRNKKVAPLSIILNRLLAAYDYDEKIRVNQVLVKWPEVVGESIANVTTPIRIKDGILYIKVKNDAWRNELYFQKVPLIQKIEKFLEKKLITEIVLL